MCCFGLVYFVINIVVLCFEIGNLVCGFGGFGNVFDSGKYCLMVIIDYYVGCFEMGFGLGNDFLKG